MQKAFVYLRVSGRGQIDGDGFTRQLEACRKYASTCDIKIVRVFREEGISGATDLENRPALTEMIAALYSNGTHIVLVEKLDRLARDLMVQETIFADLRQHGCELVSALEPDLCGDDPSRKLVRQIFGAIAEYDKAMTVLKLRGARQRTKARTGRCEGRKPYGQRPGEQSILERMRKLRAQNTPVDKIAAALNAEGIAPRSGAAHKWHGATVLKILKQA